ncbi:MAG: hypothetical protein QNJ72_24295 [Pleurocapsa sp. MO_226.B13]|nr:hypothetical protein [Pleurocapsa sp. MO_226.B13]
MFEESKVFQKKPSPFSVTMTGEPYQPARIYYQVFQKNAVQGRFRRLRCMDFDSTRNRWVWLYKEEAKNIKFTKSYRDIPKELRPIVLGSFTFNGTEELRLDVRSFERVIEAMGFFDQKINRRLAKVTTLKIVNKLFPATTTVEEMSAHHALFFEQREAVNPRDEMNQLEKITSQYEAGEERQKAALSYLEQQMKKTLAEVEELETHFYEDGIESIAMSLRMRQIEATEHWKGNKNFSQFDIMQTLLENFEE